ncbi:MAG: hypothetical protein KGZ63_00225 [Clostridiales bacterium]|nr:hypothetical protein [Clostridiales bacterium]
MNKLQELSVIFKAYKTFPLSCYKNGVPLRRFQELYSADHYSSQIEAFMQHHDYPPVQRGSDLPWWGEYFFSNSKGFKVMIISQDSLAKDAGSIVFYANLFPVCNSEPEFRRYVSSLNENQSFSYRSLKKVRDQLNTWGIDLNHCYITDAAKVYKNGSWKDRDFDKKKSKELLQSEIELCKPDLIILLGTSGLALLNKNIKYGEV